MNINQIDYRSGYLQSPLWKAIRASVIAHYGDTCSICGMEGGNDVHHVRYSAILGTENIADYQVLCRECHEAHHKAHKSTQSKRIRRPVQSRAAYKALSATMKTKLRAMFGIDNDISLYNQMCVRPSDKMLRECSKMLGIRVIHSVKGCPVRTSTLRNAEKYRRKKEKADLKRLAQSVPNSRGRIVSCSESKTF